MKSYSNSWYLLGSLTLYAMLWILLNPTLGYMLDSDCVAYLTIAERAARGDFFKSINGLWSPLNGWLLIPFLKSSNSTWEIAKAANALIGAVVILLSHILFQKWNFSKLAKWLFSIVLAVCMSYYVFFQMFGDVLQLIFLLGYFLLIFTTNFYYSFFKIALSGIVMGIAFYAKSYSLFFYGIHFFALWFYQFYLKNTTLKNAMQGYVLGMFSAFAMVLPWTYLLYQKYKVIAPTGLAGKLNMSWYINSSKTYNDSIKLLIPPVYADSPSFWEDPYWSQAALSTPFSSVTHFVKWIVRIIYTSVEAITCFQEISFFAISIILYGLFYLIKNKLSINKQTTHIHILLFSTLILPLGYLTMHIETRYIWFNSILLLLLSFVFIQEYETVFNKIKQWLFVILSFSFCLHPFLSFKKLKNKNKDLFLTAEFLNKNSIKGKFTANTKDAGRMWVIAYLTKSQFYTIEKSNYTQQELLDEIQRFQLDYYFLETENNVLETRLNEKHFQKITQLNNLVIYKIIH